jgi:hypothetical protein
VVDGAVVERHLHTARCIFVRHDAAARVDRLAGGLAKKVQEIEATNDGSEG